MPRATTNTGKYARAGPASRPDSAARQRPEGGRIPPDLNKPWLDSTPIPSFGQQAVFSISQFPTNQGHFDLGRLVLAEHHGTHLDTPGHYINNEGSMEAGGTAPGERKLAHQLTSDDLIGPAVVIDIASTAT